MTKVISLGIVDGRPVFLDERDDSYFLLEREQEAEVLKQLRDGPDGPCADPMLRDALGMEGSTTLVIARCERPRQSLVTQSCVSQRPRLADALSLARIVRRTRRSIAGRAIDAILADLVVPAGPCDEQGQQDRLLGHARRFLAARPLVPIKPNCLLDSLSLLSWLGPARSATTLVFGVKLDPFAAHCWVQAGDLLINDRPDNVERFSPVRVIQCSAVTH